MNTPEQNVIETLKGKRVLFLENDNSLDNGLDEFERILQRGKIEYKSLFEVSEMPLQEIAKEIASHDCIVFMTQWVYDVAKQLHDHMLSLKQKKIVIEVYISEPTWYYSSQHGSHHDVYIYSCMCHWGEPDKDSESFYKLSEKAYWDYENKFDQ